MPALSFNGLLVIALVAVAVPVMLALVPRLPVPGGRVASGQVSRTAGAYTVSAGMRH